jgi:hypothetical protein
VICYCELFRAERRIETPAVETRSLSGVVISRTSKLFFCCDLEIASVTTFPRNDTHAYGLLPRHPRL